MAGRGGTSESLAGSAEGGGGSIGGGGGGGSWGGGVALIMALVKLSYSLVPSRILRESGNETR